MKRVSVVDYGMGNLFSVRRALEVQGGSVEFVNSPKLIEEAERLVIPGVGAFRDGMEGLRQRGLVEPIRAFAASGRPVLGICLGMQMMLGVGEEFGLHEGLNLIPGRVVAIPNRDLQGHPHKIPHIGWNSLLPTHSKTGDQWDGTILSGVKPGEAVYFVHSYMAMADEDESRLADCSYGDLLLAATIRSGNIYGCQFHPEKSGPTGLRIISNFLSLS